jgi:allantoin racemase
MNEKRGKMLILHPMIQGVEEKRDFFAGVEDVDIIGISEGVDVIHDREDVALAGLHSVRRAKEAEEAGYEAIITTCHGDPNLYSLREAVRIPVIGIMELSMHVCSMLAHRFSVLVPNMAIKRWQEENAVKYGLISKLASVRLVPFKVPLERVLELSRKKPMPGEVIEPVVTEAIKAIREDDAGAITFGCGCLKRVGVELQKELQTRGFDVPVVNPLPLAVDFARVLVKNRLSQSLRSYPGSRA